MKSYSSLYSYSEFSPVNLSSAKSIVGICDPMYVEGGGGGDTKLGPCIAVVVRFGIPWAMLLICHWPLSLLKLNGFSSCFPCSLPELCISVNIPINYLAFYSNYPGQDRISYMLNQIILSQH